MTREESKPLPTGFLPLLRLILSLTLKNFFKSLLITLPLMAGSAALYFYIIVVKNDGLHDVGGFFERFFGVGAKGYTLFTPGLSGAVVLGVGSVLLVNLFHKRPGSAVGNLVAAPHAIQQCFRESGSFAAAGLFSGAGVALIAGSLVDGYANLVMALGAGAMLASRAAPMAALLFCSFWNSTFGVLQGGRAPQCPAGTGYSAMLGGSFGFILRAVLPKNLGRGVSVISPAPLTNLVVDPACLIGLVLIVAAGVLAATSSRRSGPVSKTIILLLTMILTAAPAIVLADDGGWKEAKGAGLEHFLNWLTSENSWLALLNSLIPALGLAFGPALWTAMLQAMSQAGAQAVGATAAAPPPLIDPDTGELLLVHDGESYEGGQAGQVWYGGQWVDRDTADQWIRERQDQLRRREEEIDRFQRETDAQRRARSEQRERDLQEQFYRWDAGQQAWVRDPDLAPHMSPDEARLYEYYRRGDWIEDNMNRLSPEQQAATRRILDRIGYLSTGAESGGISEADLEKLRRLTGAMNDLIAGRSEAEGAAADLDAASAEFAEEVARSTAQVGRIAAASIERQFIPGTQGSMSGFIFGAAENWDKGWGEAIKHGSISAATTYADGRIGGAKPGNILWNAESGALTSAADVALKGGDADDMQRAALIGGAFSGTLTGLSRVLSGGSRGPQMRTIRAGDDPSLQAGARGIGSNDLDGGVIPRTRPATPDPNLPRIHTGDDPTLATGCQGLDSHQARTLPSTQAEWRARDAELGIGPRGDELPPTGIDRPQRVDDLIRASGDPNLDRLDSKVREAWRQAGAGLDPDGWEKFQTELKSRGISEAEYNKWYRVAIEQLPPEPPPPESTATTRTGQPPPETAEPRQTTARPVEGYHHAPGGGSIEESGRLFEKTHWVVHKDGGHMEISGTAAADYHPKQGEAVLSIDRFTGEVTTLQHDPKLTSPQLKRINEQFAASLPEGRAYRPAPPAPDADAKGRYDVGTNGIADEARRQAAEELAEKLGGRAEDYLAPERPSASGDDSVWKSASSSGRGGEATSTPPAQSPRGTRLTPLVLEAHDTQATTPAPSRPAITQPRTEAEVTEYIHRGDPDSPREAAYQRAQQAADRLRGGAQFDSSPTRTLPSTEAEWKARDKELGIGPRGDELPPTGIDRPQYVDDLIRARPDLDLDKLDATVREAWRQAGGGLEPDGWEKFQAELRSLGVSEDAYNKWHSLVIERNPPPEPPPGSSKTTRTGN